MTSKAKTDHPEVDQLDFLPLNEHLCFAIYTSMHAFTRRYKPFLDKLGITYPQYICLLVLWESEGSTVKAIGDRLHLDSGTLTPLLKRLEAAGLVRRVRDKADERQVRVWLSEAGRLLQSKTAGLPAEMLCASGQTAEVFLQLREHLVQLRDALNQAET